MIKDVPNQNYVYLFISRIHNFGNYMKTDYLLDKHVENSVMLPSDKHTTSIPTTSENHAHPSQEVYNMAMGQTPVPPVNIPIPTKLD